MKVITYTLVGEDVATQIFFEAMLKEVGKRHNLIFKQSALWVFSANKNSNNDKVLDSIKKMSAMSLVVQKHDLFLFGIDSDQVLDDISFATTENKIFGYLPSNIQREFHEKLIPFCPVQAVEYWIYAVSPSLQKSAGLAASSSLPIEGFSKATMKEICYGIKAPNRDLTEDKLKHVLKKIDLEKGCQMSYSLGQLMLRLEAFCQSQKGA